WPVVLLLEREHFTATKARQHYSIDVLRHREMAPNPCRRGQGGYTDGQNNNRGLEPDIRSQARQRAAQRRFSQFAGYEELSPRCHWGSGPCPAASLRADRNQLRLGSRRLSFGF